VQRSKEGAITYSSEDLTVQVSLLDLPYRTSYDILILSQQQNEVFVMQVYDSETRQQMRLLTTVTYGVNLPLAGYTPRGAWNGADISSPSFANGIHEIDESDEFMVVIGLVGHEG